MPIDSLDKILNSASTTRSLVRHYEATIKRIMNELVAGVSKAQAFRADALLARLRTLLKDLDPKESKFLKQWIDDNIRKVYVIGDERATAELRAALRAGAQDRVRRMPPVDAQFTAVNEVAIRGLVTAMNATLGKAKDLIEAKLGTVVRQTQTSLARASAIRDASVSGFIRGATAQQVSDDIAAVLLGKKLDPIARQRLMSTGFDGSIFNTFESVARGQMITIGKRNYSVRSYSDLVANVQLREAHKVATIVRLRKNGVRHVIISKHPQDVPDVCTPFAGRVFYTGEGSDPAGFPSLRSTPNGGPPWHPYCRHSLRPYVLALRDEGEISAARSESAKVADFLGQSSTDITRQVKALPPAAIRRIASQGEGLADDGPTLIVKGQKPAGFKIPKQSSN